MRYAVRRLTAVPGVVVPVGGAAVPGQWSNGPSQRSAVTTSQPLRRA